MIIFKHELRQGKIALLIWTAAICFMLGICILIYPEMGSQMGEMSAMFADMGSFSQDFVMDSINFGEFFGVFGGECGNILGLGGAFFAALLGISSLAKEEKEHTAEFLLTHPISRVKIMEEKLLAIIAQIFILNVVAIGVTALSILAIGEEIPLKTLSLLFLAYFLMQLEIACITFGISAFLRHGSLGIGLGLAAIFYFLNIIANLTKEAGFLKYITPFGYTESADIIADKCINTGYLAVGIVLSVVSVLLAFWNYQKKDIA